MGAHQRGDHSHTRLRSAQGKHAALESPQPARFPVSCVLTADEIHATSSPISHPIGGVLLAAAVLHHAELRQLHVGLVKAVPLAASGVLGFEVERKGSVELRISWPCPGYTTSHFPVFAVCGPAWAGPSFLRPPDCLTPCSHICFLPQAWMDRFFLETRPRLMTFRVSELAQVNPNGLLGFGTSTGEPELPSGLPRLVVVPELAQAIPMCTKYFACAWRSARVARATPPVSGSTCCLLAPSPPQIMHAFGTQRVHPPRQWLNQLLLAAFSKMDVFGPKVGGWAAAEARGSDTKAMRH